MSPRGSLPSGTRVEARSRERKKTYSFHPARIVHEHRLDFSPLMQPIGISRVSQLFLKLARREARGD